MLRSSGSLRVFRGIGFYKYFAPDGASARPKIEPQGRRSLPNSRVIAGKPQAYRCVRRQSRERLNLNRGELFELSSVRTEPALHALSKNIF
jgi:hypothetical protein